MKKLLFFVAACWFAIGCSPDENKGYKTPDINPITSVDINEQVGVQASEILPILYAPGGGGGISVGTVAAILGGYRCTLTSDAVSPSYLTAAEDYTFFFTESPDIKSDWMLPQYKEVKMSNPIVFQIHNPATSILSCTTDPQGDPKQEAFIIYCDGNFVLTGNNLTGDEEEGESGVLYSMKMFRGWNIVWRLTTGDYSLVKVYSNFSLPSGISWYDVALPV